MAALENIYINAAQFQWILQDMNLEDSPERQQDILDRATADLEADLSEKFVVPLRRNGGAAFSTCADFARNKVLNAMKAKIREIIGFDKNRNSMAAIESTQKFINVHSTEYQAQIKTLLAARIDFGFQMQAQAEDSQTPVQSIALSRANNNTDPYDDSSGDPYQ